MTLFSCLIVLLSFQTGLAACGPDCKFSLCFSDGLSTPKPPGAKFILRAPGTSLSGYICRPGSVIRRVISTGEPNVMLASSGDPAVPISQFAPQGLRERFPADYFGFYDIPFLDGMQGLGRKTSVSNQEAFVNDLCVVLPITAYEVARGRSKGFRVVRTEQKGSCLSFRTRLPKVLVELTWTGSDDLDLMVREPNGIVLSNSRNLTKAGRLNASNKENVCSAAPASKETALYDVGGPIQKGFYRVAVRRVKNCGKGTTDWLMRIVIDGKMVEEKSGSLEKSEVKVLSTSFRM